MDRYELGKLQYNLKRFDKNTAQVFYELRQKPFINTAVVTTKVLHALWNL